MKKSAQKVTSVNLGSKRVCPKCGTKFYDFGKTDELECPKCRAAIDLESANATVLSEIPKRAPKAKDLNEEVLVEEETPTAEPEFESLEDLEEDDDDDLVEDLDVASGGEEGGDF